MGKNPEGNQGLKWVAALQVMIMIMIMGPETRNYI